MEEVHANVRRFGRRCLGFALLPGSAKLDPEIRQPAPAFTLLDAQGKKHSLADYKGKMVVIEWVNITCPYPEANYKAGVVQKLQKEYAAKGVVWLSMIITADQQDQYGKNMISPQQADSMARAVSHQRSARVTRAWRSERQGSDGRPLQCPASTALGHRAAQQN